MRSNLGGDDKRPVLPTRARGKDWPTLEAAVEQKMEDQTEFVRWWREQVRGPGKTNSRRSGGIDAPRAEELTGITNQQVSKWGQRLQDRETYRNLLYGQAGRGGEAAETVICRFCK